MDYEGVLSDGSYPTVETCLEVVRKYRPVNAVEFNHAVFQMAHEQVQEAHRLRFVEPVQAVVSRWWQEWYSGPRI